MATLTELRDERIKKLNKLVEMGINPYPPTSDRNTNNGDIKSKYENFENKEVIVSGRVINIRDLGKLAFITLKDETENIQLYIKPDAFSEASQISFENLGLFDPGDFLEAKGTVTKSKSGEVSVLVSELKFLAKALRPLPDTHFGVKDMEERYRKRYLDLILSPDAKKLLDIRWLMTRKIREFLWKEGFKEVETPVLQSLYGGTNSKPFTTHMNALNQDFYLRIAPELYLKRLVVGGYEKIFEIARNFRNEGIDQSHFPEFSMIEWYEAYADYNRVMDLAEGLAKFLVKEIYGTGEISVNGKKINIDVTWRRVSVEDLLQEKLNIKWSDVDEKRAKELEKEYKIKVKGAWSVNKVLYTIVDKKLVMDLESPTFLIDLPKDVSPLAKSHRSKEGRTERFEGYIGGIEIFDGWSELVSGLEQRERFENEQKNMKEGDDESMPLDENFLEALEYGCPPLGGIGFGIERMAMFLTDRWMIKEVTAFPILKSEE